MMVDSFHKDFLAQRDLNGRLAEARAALTKLASPSQLSQAAAKVDTNPTDAQKEEGNYRKGHYYAHGLHFVIENPIGSARQGTSENGEPWHTVMKHHYGYIAGTEGNDDDAVDVFLNPEYIDCELFFVVNQLKMDGKTFDEHKVMCGFLSEETAREGYLANYTPGWKGCGSIKPMTLPKLKEWLKEGDMTKRAMTGVSVQIEHTVIASKTVSKAMQATSYRKEDEHPYTVACDLDGTLAETEEPFDPLHIGKCIEKTRKKLVAFREAGAQIIIFTVRGNVELVRQWATKNDVPADHINWNPYQPPAASGKICAEVYLDDRAYNIDDLDEIAEDILEAIKGHGKKHLTPVDPKREHTAA